MSHSESYDYLIFRITGSFLNRYLGTLDCSRALLTRNSRGPSRTVLDFDLKGEIPMFCLVFWLVPLLSIGPSRTVDSVRDRRRGVWRSLDTTGGIHHPSAPPFAQGKGREGCVDWRREGEGVVVVKGKPKRTR